MRLFWWQHLPLLILIQLLEPRSTSHAIYAEAFIACKNAVGIPRPPSGWIRKYPCIRQRAFLGCYKPKDQAVVSLIFFSSDSPIEAQEEGQQSRNKRRKAASVDGNGDVPTLTPLQQADIKKPERRRYAAIVGGIGATLLVIAILVFVYICLMRVKRFIRRTSERESSMPSPSAAELEGRVTSRFPYSVPPNGTQNLRQLSILELKLATSDFSRSNIIGEGTFGLVYKGLLQDGSIVAIKRRIYAPLARDFVHEVKHLARVHHRHLVKLVGYCNENHQELLVYDYIPCGNVGNHLYDSEGLPTGKLNLRQRLLIALGAAKGLEHLHSLVPPLFHMHFRTSNVLLDENFTAKVSDYGLAKMVMNSRHAGSSSAVDIFLDPELNTSKKFLAESDVYSFGVFLLELISGRDVNNKNQPEPEENLVLQAKRSSDIANFVDKALYDQAMDVAHSMMELAMQCVDVSPRRPSMRRVVEEIERVQEREIGRLHSEIGDVTLGSELFK